MNRKQGRTKNTVMGTAEEMRNNYREMWVTKQANSEDKGTKRKRGEEVVLLSVYLPVYRFTEANCARCWLGSLGMWLKKRCLLKEESHVPSPPAQG